MDACQQRCQAEHKGAQLVGQQQAVDKAVYADGQAVYVGPYLDRIEALHASLLGCIPWTCRALLRAVLVEKVHLKTVIAPAVQARPVRAPSVGAWKLCILLLLCMPLSTAPLWPALAMLFSCWRGSDSIRLIYCQRFADFISLIYCQRFADFMDLIYCQRFADFIGLIYCQRFADLIALGCVPLCFFWRSCYFLEVAILHLALRDPLCRGCDIICPGDVAKDVALLFAYRLVITARVRFTDGEYTAAAAAAAARFATPFPPFLMRIIKARPAVIVLVACIHRMWVGRHHDHGAHGKKRGLDNDVVHDRHHDSHSGEKLVEEQAFSAVFPSHANHVLIGSRDGSPRVEMRWRGQQPGLVRSKGCQAGSAQHADKADGSCKHVYCVFAKLLHASATYTESFCAGQTLHGCAAAAREATCPVQHSCQRHSATTCTLSTGRPTCADPLSSIPCPQRSRSSSWRPTTMPYARIRTGTSSRGAWTPLWNPSLRWAPSSTRDPSCCYDPAPSSRCPCCA